MKQIDNIIQYFIKAIGIYQLVFLILYWLGMWQPNPIAISVNMLFIGILFTFGEFSRKKMP